MKKWIAGRPGKEQDYYQKMMEMFGIGSGRMAFVRKKSIRNQFYSDLVMPFEKGISVSGTTVHCFYAVKMGMEYEKWYRQLLNLPISAGMICSMRSC